MSMPAFAHDEQRFVVDMAHTMHPNRDTERKWYLDKRLLSHDGLNGEPELAELLRQDCANCIRSLLVNVHTAQRVLCIPIEGVN